MPLQLSSKVYESMINTAFIAMVSFSLPQLHLIKTKTRNMLKDKKKKANNLVRLTQHLIRLLTPVPCLPPLRVTPQLLDVTAV